MRERFRTFDSRISFFAFADIITAVCGVLIFITLLLATDLTNSPSQSSQSADPALEQKLAESLRQQAEADAQARQLQQLLTAAETAPGAEKLEADISRLRASLAEEKKKNAILIQQVAANHAAVDARDRTLGFTDLKAQIRSVLQAAEALARQESKVREDMSILEKKVTSAQAKVLKLHERQGKLWIIPDKSSTTKEPLAVIVSSNGAAVMRFDRPGETKEFAGPNARGAFNAYLRDAKPVDQYFVFYVKPSGIELFEEIVKSARERNFDVGSDAVPEKEEVSFAHGPTVDETPVPPIPSEPATNATRSSPGASIPVQTNFRTSTLPATNAHPQTASVDAQPPPPPPPPPAKPKSWWQRFLEWIHLA